MKFRGARAVEKLAHGLGVALAAGMSPLAAAAAQPAPAANDTAVAAQLFKEGKAQFIQGDFQAACPKLEESYRLVADLGALLALATCHEEQGNLPRAYGEFSRAEPLVQREGRTDRIALVTEHLARLRPLVQEAAPPAPALAPDQALIAPPATTDLDRGRSADAAEPDPPEHGERGVFLQASFGAGYTFDTGGEVDSLVPWGALLVGGTLTPGLAAGGGVAVSDGLTIGGPFLALHPDGPGRVGGAAAARRSVRPRRRRHAVRFWRYRRPGL